MRKVLYVLLLVPVLFVPLERVNVAKLLPVEAVAIYMDGDKVVLETDTQHKGTGETAVQALEDLKKNTTAVVYLDTAAYLLVSQDAVAEVAQLRSWLKPSVRVWICDAKGAVKDTAKYVDIHQKPPKLKAWKPENYTG